MIEIQDESGLPHLHAVLQPALDPVLSSALTLLQSRDGAILTVEQRAAVIQLGEGAVTVATDIDSLLYQFPDLTLEQAEEAVRLALRHQVHTCTHSCKEVCAEGQKCRHFFPRPPSLFTLLATTPDLLTPEAKERMGAVEAMLEKVQELLRTNPNISQPREEDEPVAALVAFLLQVADRPQPLGEGYYFWAGAIQGPTEEMEQLLLHCGALVPCPLDALLLAIYHCYLLNRQHPKLLPVRLLKEAYMVNYHPWLLLAWEANMELEVVTHTPSALFKYVTKGCGQKSLDCAVTELRNRGSCKDSLAARRLESAKESGRREVTITEGMFRMDPRLSLSVTSTAGMVVFINTALPGGTHSTEEGIRRDKEQYSLR